MRRLTPVLLLLALAAPAPAQARGVRAPGGEHRAVAGRGEVRVDGRRVWRGRRVLSPLVWSDQGGALAFTARDRGGRTTLVVVIFLDGADPAAMTWAVPRAAEPARAVTWLGATRLGAGPSELEPRLVASFSARLQ
jgi:hypothetical protein